MEQGPYYLPAPELIARAGIDYPHYELGTIVGDGEITFAWKEVACRFKLKIGTASNRITIVGVERTKDAEETYLLFEGELAKGISDTFYIRGLYHIRTPLELTPEAIKRPFCIFQLTPGGSIPEVATSAMGVRYAGLKQKSYTMLVEGLKLDGVGPRTRHCGCSRACQIGDALEWLSIHDFYSLLPRGSPRVIICDIYFEHRDQPGVFSKSICLFWYLGGGQEGTFSLTFPIAKLALGPPARAHQTRVTTRRSHADPRQLAAGVQHRTGCHRTANGTWFAGRRRC